jgi:Short C-terminal domain
MLGKLSKRTRKRLQESGRRASATVLEVSDSGIAVTSGSGALVSDTEVALKVHLRVEPEGEPAFELHERFRFSQLAVPVAGQKVAVIFDPDDHDTIMIDDDPAATAGAMLAGSGRSESQVDMIQQVMKAATTGGDPAAIARQWAEQQASAAGGPTVFIGGQMVPPPGGGAPADPAGPAYPLPAGMTSPPAPPAEVPDDPIEQITRLADLRDRGALTDAEFNAQKAKILGW